MLFTKASEYALIAMIYVAKCDKPIDVDTLSSELEISKSFLAKILQHLARAGLLNSYKGVNGGFLLAKDSSQIRLSDIICAAEKRSIKVFECSTGECPSGKTASCVILPILKKLQDQVDDYLSGVSLEELCRG